MLTKFDDVLRDVFGPKFRSYFWEGSMKTTQVQREFKD